MVVSIATRVQGPAHRLKSTKSIGIRWGYRVPPAQGCKQCHPRTSTPVRWYSGTLVRISHMLGDHSLLGGANEPGTVVPVLSACVCRVWQALHNPTKPSGSR